VKILFIGGNGIISSASSRLAIERGHELTLLNRGLQSSRPPIEGAEHLQGDANDPVSIAQAIGDRRFDAVVNFRAFTPEQVAADVDTFAGRVGHYVFISSASAYRKPVTSFPIVESTPLHNPFWAYSRAKAAAEGVLASAFEQHGFPATVVRPSHTYDPSLIPIDGGWTVIDRMRRGKPVLVHGDGTSLWTLTHQRDFAVGLVGLLGQGRAVGEAYHITSDEVLTWDMIADALAAAAGVRATIVHAGSDRIARAFPEWADGIVGDKAHSLIFDNSKIRSLVPDFAGRTRFAEGAREIVAWYDAEESRRHVDGDIDRRLDAFIEAESA
jgi:nucleoside-diphosphate-sugar epimerase